MFYQCQITNQIGAQLNLPPEESKILVTAMTLHEKGRSALKKGHYSLALVFLLEADSEFKLYLFSFDPAAQERF